MNRRQRWRRRRLAIALLAPLVLLFGRPQDCVAAQGPQGNLPATPVEHSDGGPGVPILPSGGRSIRISLQEHRLYVLDGERVQWSARIGTGTGETLEGAGQSWDFSTPRGLFRIQYKEKEPVAASARLLRPVYHRAGIGVAMDAERVWYIVQMYAPGE